jgi:diguanylate cyclase (GGDEF)-like protein
MLEDVYLPKINKGWYYNVFMIDINDLHNYNRTYGYNEGDKYIKNIVNEIKKAIKEQKVSASIYRTGGDEFIIFVQPYDKLSLNNINNITYAETIFNSEKTFKQVVDELDEKIIKDKNGIERTDSRNN